MLARILLFISSLYLALAAGDLAFSLTDRQPARLKAYQTSVKGLFQLSRTSDYEMLPGWEGLYDDGVVRTPVRVNSRGHRDDEVRPLSASQRRILLGGDSFAFGQGLSSDATIDKQMERLSNDRIDVYNLGVMGYGSLQVLESLRATREVPADTFLYLFYPNDLRGDAVQSGFYTVFDGYLVPNRNPSSGEPHSEADYRRILRRFESADSPALRFATLRDSARLLHLRKRIAAAIDPANARLCDKAKWYPRDGWKFVRRNVRLMKAEAMRRRMRFLVAVAPTLCEAARGDYSPQTQQLVDALQEDKHDLIEFLDDMSPEDYFSHNAHFNPAGAEKAARILLRAAPCANEV